MTPTNKGQVKDKPAQKETPPAHVSGRYTASNQRRPLPNRPAMTPGNVRVPLKRNI
jgi:hypothetical protein